MRAESAEDRLAQVTNAQVAQLLFERMGVSPAELLGAATRRPEIPLLAGYIPQVSGAVGSGTRRVYSSYWDRVLEVWGQRRLDEITALDIRQLSELVKANAVVRRNARDGRGAAEHLIAALRCIYRYAVADGLNCSPQQQRPPRTPARTTAPVQR